MGSCLIDNDSIQDQQVHVLVLYVLDKNILVLCNHM